jgi:hypothetical protein
MDDLTIRISQPAVVNASLSAPAVLYAKSLNYTDFIFSTAAETPNAIVRRDGNGQANFTTASSTAAAAAIYATATGGSGTFAIDASGTNGSNGFAARSVSGSGALLTSGSSLGAQINSNTGSDIAAFQNASTTAFAVERVNGILRWIKDSYTGRLTVATLTANRTWTLPNESGTLALTANKLSAFAATTSAELAGVISDETGSGSLVFGTSPSISSPVISGAASFISTADRPTSAATGPPAATSLITYADAETLALREMGGWLTHRVDNFETALLSSVGGTAGSFATTGSTDRPSMSYRPNSSTGSASNYQALLGLYLTLSAGTLRDNKNWSKRSRMSFVTMIPSLSAGTIRYYWGPASTSWTGGSLSVRGIGFEIINNSVYAVCHNGSSKTTSFTSVALSLQITTQLAIESDGIGGVRWWVNNVEQSAIFSGGPTGTSGIYQYGFCTQAINPASAASTFVFVSNLLLASKI